MLILALDCTLPLLTMGLGYIEGVTCDDSATAPPRCFHPGRGHRCGYRRVQTQPPALGVPEFPTADRQGGPP